MARVRSRRSKSEIIQEIVKHLNRKYSFLHFLNLYIVFLARGHLLPETSVSDICVRLFASGNIRSGHLRPDICVRLFASGNIRPRYLSPVHLRPDICVCVRTFYKFQDANVRNATIWTHMSETEMSEMEVSGRKCPGANVRTQLFGRKSPGRKFPDASDPSPLYMERFCF